MKAKFSIVHFLMLVGLLIGCGETDQVLLSSHESNPSLRAAVSVDTLEQPLPSIQEEVAAAPPLLVVAGAVVVPIVSCGATAIELAALFVDTPQFLANNMLWVGMAGIACPADKPLKGIKVFKSLKTLQKAKFGRFTSSNSKMNFEKLIGRPVKPKHEVHHGIPQKFEVQARKNGINIHQPWHLIEIKGTYHRSITPSYTKDWGTFFDQPYLNGAKILEFQEAMLKKYNLKPGSHFRLDYQ